MSCNRDSRWCWLVRFLDVRDDTHNEFVPVQTDDKVVLEKRPKHQSEGFPFIEVMLKMPKVNDVYYIFFLFVLVSLVCLLITIICKESYCGYKYNKVFSSHIFHMLVGVLVALIEYGIYKDDQKYSPMYITSAALQTFLVPLLFESTFAMYHMLFFDQLIPILTFALLTNWITVHVVSIINWKLVELLLEWPMTYSQMCSMVVISNAVHILAVYSYFPLPSNRPRHKYFYLLLGIHQLQNITAEGTFEIVLALSSFESKNQAPSLSVFYLVLRCLIQHLASIVVGIIIGLAMVLVSRLMRQTNNSCKFFEPYIIVFGLISTYMLCRAYKINRSFGVVFCSFIQQRYMYCNFSYDSIRAVKTGIRTIALEVEIVFYVLVGYKIVNIVDLDEFYFSMITMCLLLVIRALVIILISFVMNQTSVGKIGWKLQALIIFGSLRGPRTVGFILQLSGKNYDTEFINAQFYMVLFNLFVDATISKYLSHLIREEEPEGVKLPGERIIQKFLKCAKRKEEYVYEMLVGY